MYFNADYRNRKFPPIILIAAYTFLSLIGRNFALIELTEISFFWFAPGLAIFGLYLFGKKVVPFLLLSMISVYTYEFYIVNNFQLSTAIVVAIVPSLLELIQAYVALYYIKTKDLSNPFSDRRAFLMFVFFILLLPSIFTSWAWVIYFDSLIYSMPSVGTYLFQKIAMKTLSDAFGVFIIFSLFSLIKTNKYTNVKIGEIVKYIGFTLIFAIVSMISFFYFQFLAILIVPLLIAALLMSGIISLPINSLVILLTGIAAIQTGAGFWKSENNFNSIFIFFSLSLSLILTIAFIHSLLNEIKGSRVTDSSIETTEPKIEFSDSLKSFIQNSPLGIIAINNDDQIIKINSAAQKITGYLENEIRLGNLKLFIADESYSIIETMKSEHHKEASFQHIKLKNKSNDWKNVLASMTHVEYNGEIVLLLYFIDETEKIKIQQNLDESIKLMDILLAHIPIYLFIKDNNDRTLVLSHQYEKMLGKPISELLNKTSHDLFPKELADKIKADDQEIFWKNILFEVEEELNGKHYFTKKMPIKLSDNKSILIGFTADITELKSTELELKKIQVQLEQLVSERTSELTSKIDELSVKEKELTESRNLLERRVQERTLLLNTKNDELVSEISLRKNIEESLRRSEAQLNFKLEAITSPNVELELEELIKAIDLEALEKLFNQFHSLTGYPISITDVNGNTRIRVGWVKACESFHRVNSKSCKNCTESDVYLTQPIGKSEIRIYKCKNNLWEAVTPIYLGDKHVLNLFFGQFFFNDEELDLSIFEQQSNLYGFDHDEYLKAVKEIRRFSRTEVEAAIKFYSVMADIICSTSLSNIKLAKILNDLKNKESELIRSRNRYEGLFKNSPISVWEQDYSEVVKYVQGIQQEGVTDLRDYLKQNKKYLLECTKLLKIVGVNNFTLKLFEATTEEELFSNFKRLIMPKSLNHFADSIINLYEGKRSFEGELELRTLKGKKINVEYFIAATPGREGQLDYVIVNMLDVTEKKETLNQLEAERKQLEVFFGTAVDLLCIANLEGKFVRLNKEWENVLGYSIEELVGKDFYSFIHPDDIDATIKATSVLKEGEMVLNFVNRYRCKDNSYRWIEWKSISNNNLIYAAARDITNSYNFNIELQRSESRYRELFETMAQGVIYQDEKGRIINANPAAQKLLGIKLEKMIADDIVEEWNNFINLDGSILSQEEHPAFLALQTGKQVTNKVLGVYNSEIMDWVWVMVNAIPQFREGEEKPYQVFSTLDNITELKMAQDSLMASEERYSLAQRAAQIGSWDWDILTNDVGWSNEIEGMFGFEPGGFDGRFETYINCIHPNDRPLMLNSIDQAMRGADFNVEVRIVWQNGEVHWINGTGDVVYNTDHIPIRMLGIVQDITARKLAENEVKANEEKFRRIFEDSPLGLIILSSDFSFLEVNSAFSKLLGYYTNELRSISLPSIIHPDDLNEILAGIKQLGERKIQQCRSELRYITRYGEIIWANFSVSILRNSDGTFRSFLAMISDISDRKKAEELLISAKNEAVQKSNELKELNATKDKFFSIIAHDLKNPFFYLLASSQFIKEEFNNLDENEKYEIVSRFHDGTGKIYKLLENLLQWSRMKLDRIEFKVEDITLSSIIKEELEDSELGTENKNITITKKYNDDITFKADRNMFRTVIRNLISNAIKFSHKGGEIIVSAKSEPNLFSFSVQDFGVGIPQNNLEKLFKIDGEVSTKGTNDEEGTGLGLILCKEFIDKHNGTIKVESEPKKGSTFTVSIPQN